MGDNIGEPGGGRLKDDSEDLVSQDQESENWRGIGIALLVIAIICSLIVTSIVLLTPEDKGPRVKNDRLSLEEFLSGAYQPRTFNGSWISETELVYQAPTGGLVIFNAATATQTPLIANVSFGQLNSDAYSLSPNRQYLLVRSHTQYTSSHSFYAQYTIFNISNERTFPVVSAEFKNKVRYAAWGPTNSQLVYVVNNNLFYLARIGNVAQQLTTDGAEGVKLNGIVGISYEGLMESGHAVWCSEDGAMLAYLSIDLSAVNLVKRLRYGSYEEASNLNPKVVEQRYPKPGSPIPRATLWVLDLKDPNFEAKEVIAPKLLRQQEYYITSATWLDNRRILVTWTLRSQNYSATSICAAERRWECEKHYEETSSTGWVDVQAKPLVSADKWHYFLRTPVADGRAGNFRHVSMVDINSKGIKTILTHGRYDVERIVAHRKDSRSLYYLSSLLQRPGQRHLFRVSDAKSANPRDVTCLTCHNVSQPECLYHDVVFSPGARYYVLICLGPGVPFSEIRSVDNNSLITVLETNSDLRERLDERALPQIKKFHVPLPGGFDARVQVFLPPGLYEEEIIKYPVLLEIDSSPGSQAVSEQFQLGWGSYMASRKDYIYILVDGRGSGFQGDKSLHELYKRLGTVEIADQIDVIRTLKNDLTYVDSERIGAWGWGYGGYATIATLASDPGTFTCGVAVAPVTNWRYYDAAYTERYMQSPKPEDNYIGYEKSNVNLKAANLKDKKFLLVHGTADEKMHFQHSVMLMKALVAAGVSFQTQVYPDQKHDLLGVKPHLYSTMENFFDRCFAKPKVKV